MANRFRASRLQAYGLDQLCPTRGPVEGFERPSLGYRCSKGIQDTDNLSFFDILSFDIFDADVPQCYFITSFTIALRIRTLSVH